MGSPSAVSLLLLALAAVAAGAAPGRSVDACGSVVVVGSATVKRQSDKADVNIRVEATTPTVTEAKSLVAGASARALAALEKAGVNITEDVTTGGYGIWDASRWERDPKKGTQTKVTRFRVSHSLELSTTNLSALGPIIDTATEVEASAADVSSASIFLSGPFFKLTDAARAALADRARKAAVEDGAARAALYADAAGVPLGPLVRLSETPECGCSEPPRPTGPMYRTAAVEAAPAATVVLPGEVSETREVHLTYALAGCGPTRAGGAYWRAGGDKPAPPPASSSRSAAEQDAMGSMTGARP